MFKRKYHIKLWRYIQKKEYYGCRVHSILEILMYVHINLDEALRNAAFFVYLHGVYLKGAVII